MQSKSHELQNITDQMLHGRNELHSLRNADHMIDQKLIPLRSEHTSLEATVNAQEQVGLVA